MNILVLGCGQIGAQLVRRLDAAGNDVSLIVSDAAALKLLDTFEGYRFSGTALVGDCTDPDILRRGGVESCDALAAVTPDDSDNLMAAQLAQRLFAAKCSLCLVSDPGLEKLYREKFGIATLCPALLAVNAAADVLLRAAQS